MKACIVTTQNTLGMINALVNQNNVQICAIVIDDRTAAINAGCPAELVFAYWEFREVVQQMKPDYILFLCFGGGFVTPFQRELKQINYPVENICVMSDYINKEALELSALLHKFKEDSTKYSIMVTGSSYIYNAILPEEFELPLFSFAMPSQDLYFDFAIVKKAFEIDSISYENILQPNLFDSPPPRKIKFVSNMQ